MIREFHEVANIFPMMQGEEFDALKSDIDTNGLREPIWLHQDGRIIDGRNRYLACCELGIEPQYRTWNGVGSLVAFVVSLNLHRRHLDVGQRGMIALTVKDMLAEEIAAAKVEKGREAAQKQWYGPSINGEGLIQLDQTLEMETPRDALAEAADSVGVSKTTVIRAQAVQRHDPELAAKVSAGEVSLNAAYREVQHQQKKQAPPLPTNKYRVWYADPPWEYGNAGVIGETDNYGHAARHYPTMSIADLCDMGNQIKEACEPNAVLFMWVTSPLLEECFDVIRAWGFQYKTSFVWDKVGHNYGHYNSVRHELLLVCTRGSCTPDDKTLYDSVISIEKSRTHSEKPAEFRRMIDSLYTWGNRIELFARCAADGWDAWGNEA
jgi:N6-adenosine-specific RNA methylase IME4